MEYYSTLKSKILSFMTKWTDLEDIMLSEISPSSTKEGTAFRQWSVVWGPVLVSILESAVLLPWA
jgi:hypothetical protein